MSVAVRGGVYAKYTAQKKRNENNRQHAEHCRRILRNTGPTVSTDGRNAGKKVVVRSKGKLFNEHAFAEQQNDDRNINV